jgi:hypothetical protein
MENLRKRIYFLLWLFKIKKSIDPPRFVKEKIIRFYKKKYGINTLIETGTYEGEMIFALKDDFEKIISIELDKNLVKNAKERFSNYKHIKIVLGDSGEKLKNVLKETQSPCIFWLDAHYSGGKSARGKRETPIREELKEIVKHPEKDIILVNDANNFNEGNYPSYEEIKEILQGKFSIQTKNNIIRILPKNKGHI